MTLSWRFGIKPKLIELNLPLGESWMRPGPVMEDAVTLAQYAMKKRILPTCLVVFTISAVAVLLSFLGIFVATILA